MNSRSNTPLPFTCKPLNGLYHLSGLYHSPLILCNKVQIYLHDEAKFHIWQHANEKVISKLQKNFGATIISESVTYGVFVLCPKSCTFYFLRGIRFYRVCKKSFFRRSSKLGSLYSIVLNSCVPIYMFDGVYCVLGTVGIHQ